MTDEEKKAVELMIEAAKDAEYLEDAMLLGYRKLKEHKYPKPPKIDMSKVENYTINRVPAHERERMISIMEREYMRNYFEEPPF